MYKLNLSSFPILQKNTIQSLIRLKSANEYSFSDENKPSKAQIEKLIEHAFSWGLAQDIYYHLNRTDLLKEVEKATRIRLEVNRLQCIENETAFVSQVIAISTAFDDKKIDYVLLKGAALISGGYTMCSGQRIHSDIDLLVRFKDLDNAYDVLQQLDFNCKINLERPLTSYWNSKHLPPMVSDQYKYHLEVHHKQFENTLRYSSPFDTEEIFESRQAVNYNGVNTFIPSAEMLLISAFYHSEIFDNYASARINNYRAMLDVSLILTKSGNQIDWKFITETVKNLNLYPQFRSFLQRCNYCFDRSLSQLENFPKGKPKNSVLRSLNESNDFVGNSISTLITYTREITRFNSKEGKLQSKMLLKANPDNWKYQALYQQFLNPNILFKRLRDLKDRINKG